MPRFAYTARDRSGQKVSSVQEAPSRKDAIRLLTARGLHPVQIEEQTGSATKKSSFTAPALVSSRSRRNGAFTRRLRLPFLESLHDLTGSGLSAGESVRLLSLRLKEPALRGLCIALWEKLSEGRSLSQAVEELPEVFDPQTINLLRAGEATGSLNEVLARLIQHFNDQRELRQKIITAMAYPIFICTVAIIVILFFVFYLLPRLQTLLSSLGGKLPLATRLMVTFSDAFVLYGPFVLLALIAAGIAFWRWRKSPAGLMASDNWLLKLPFVGAFMVNSTILSLTQTLAVLLENGVTTPDALRMAERTIVHLPLRKTFSESADRVLEGESLSAAMTRTGWFPDLVLDRLAVGENTGHLAPSLRNISRTYQRTLSNQLQFLTRVISTAVLFLAFAFVAFIAYAIVSAVFAVSASFRF